MVATTVLQNSQQGQGSGGVAGGDFGQNIMRLRERQEALRQRQEAEQRAKLNMVANAVDWKDFATGTPLDPIIQQGVNGILTQYTERIRNNKSEGIASIMADMQRDVAGLKEYSTKAKTIRANIDNLVETYSKDNPDILKNDLRMKAYAEAFMRIDPETGAVSFRKPGELDPAADFVSPIITKMPEQIGFGKMTGLYKYLTSLRDFTPGGKSSEKNKGVTEVYNWSDKIKDFQEIVYDNEGNAVGSRVKRAPEQFEYGGQKLDMLPEQDYQLHFGQNQNRFYLDAQINQMSGGLALTETEREKMRRHVAYQLLTGFFPENANFKKEHGTRKDNVVTRVELGLPAIGTGGRGRTGPSGRTAEQEQIVLQEYDEMLSMVRANRSRGQATLSNQINAPKQKLIVKTLQDIGISETERNPLNWFLWERNGKVGVYRVSQTNDGKPRYSVAAENLITELDPAAFDISANKELGVGARKKAAENHQSKEPNQAQRPTRKTIKRSDIPKKASAAGYTVAEYEALLKKNGIEIVN